MSEPVVDAWTAQRLREDDPTAISPLLPSGAPMPVEAQRDYRGKVILVILVLILVGIGLAFALVVAVQSRRIIYTPDAERIGASVAVRDATEFEVEATLRQIVTRLESWTPESVGRVYEQVLPFLHPSLHQSIAERYQKASAKAKALWQHRGALVLGVASGGRQANGVRDYAIFWTTIEMTGSTDRDRKIDAVVRKAATIQVVQDVPSKANPAGILVVNYQAYSEEAWRQAGLPPLWDDYSRESKK